MPDAQLHLDIEAVSPDCLLVRCRNILSWDERDLLPDTVVAALEQRPRVAGVILDLRNVQFISSAGLGALIQLRRELTPRNVGIALTGVAPQALRVLQTVGLDRMLRIHGSATDAQSALCVAPPES
jgi:anti-sigma B factor antagonist